MKKGKEKVYILIDPIYMPSFWCTACRRGLEHQALDNNIQPIYMTDIVEIYRQCEIMHALIVVSARTDWVERVIYENKRHGIKTILVGAAIESFDEDISGPMIDRRQAIEQFVQHFIANGRTRIASVGNKPEDFNDSRRAELFLKVAEAQKLNISAKDIFHDYGDIDECLSSFLSHTDSYDAAICVNDYVAVLLNHKAKQLGIRIPNDLFVCGAGDMMTSMCCVPDITTSTLNYHEMGRQAIDIWLQMNRNPTIATIRVTLSNEIIWRGSTGTLIYDKKPTLVEEPLHRETQLPAAHYAEIELIENCLQQCDTLDCTIIKGILNKKSFESIALDAFVSIGTVYYRLKRIYSWLHVNNRSEFLEAMQYIGNVDALFAVHH